MSETTIQDKLCAVVGLAALLMAGLIGCETGPLAKSNFTNPFEQPDTSYKQLYGMTPAQIARQIRELGDSAANMTQTEQRLACEGLVERYSKEPDALIRREMVYALGFFSDPHPLSGLQAAVNDTDPFVRVEACRAWSRRRSTEALNVLSSIAQTDDNTDVRQAAVRGLRHFQSPEAIRALGSLMNERDPALQYLAIQSLKTAAGKDLGDDVRKWNEYIASNYGDVPAESTASTPAADVGQSDAFIAEMPATDSWQ